MTQSACTHCGRPAGTNGYGQRVATAGGDEQALIEAESEAAVHEAAGQSR